MPTQGDGFSPPPHRSGRDRWRGPQRRPGRAGTSCPQGAVIRLTFYSQSRFSDVWQWGSHVVAVDRIARMSVRGSGRCQREAAVERDVAGAVDAAVELEDLVRL